MNAGAGVIELIGPPGAGKSSLAPFVLEALEDRGFTVYSPIEAARPFAGRTIAGRIVTRVLPSSLHRKGLWALFRIRRMASGLVGLLLNPTLTRLTVWRQFRRPPGAAVRSRRTRRWFLLHLGTQRFLTRQIRDSEILVFEEGFSHRVVQLFASPFEAPGPTDIATYLDAVPTPALLVHISAPTDVCLARIVERGVWAWLKDGDRQDLENFVTSAHRATELAVHHATASAWDVATVSNGGPDLEYSARQVEVAIAARFPAQAGSGAARGVNRE